MLKFLRRLLIVLVAVVALLLAATFAPNSGPILFRLVTAFGISKFDIHFEAGHGNLWSPIVLEKFRIADPATDVELAAEEVILILDPLGWTQWQEPRWLETLIADGVTLETDLDAPEDPLAHSLMLLLFQEETRRATPWSIGWRANWFLRGQLDTNQLETPLHFLIDSPTNQPGIALAHDERPFLMGAVTRDRGQLRFAGVSRGPADLTLNQLALHCDVESRQPRQVQLVFKTLSQEGQLQVDFNRTAEPLSLAATVVGEHVEIEALEPQLARRLGLAGGRFDFHASWTAHFPGRVDNFAFDGRGRDLRAPGFQLGDLVFAGHATKEQLHLRRLTLTQENNRIEATAVVPREFSFQSLTEEDWQLSGIVSLANPEAFEQWTPLLKYVALEQDGALHMDINLGRTEGWSWGYAKAHGYHLALAGIPFAKLEASLSLEGNELHLQQLKAEGAGDNIAAYAWVDLSGSELFNAWIKADLTHLETARDLLPELPWLNGIQADGLKLTWHGDGSLTMHSAAFSIESASLHPNPAAPVYSDFAVQGTYSPDRLVLREWKIATEAIRLQGSATVDHARVELEVDAFDTAKKERGSLRAEWPTLAAHYTEFLIQPSIDLAAELHFDAQLLGLPAAPLAKFFGVDPIGTGEIWGMLSWHGSMESARTQARLVLPDFQPAEAYEIPGPLYFEATAASSDHRLNTGLKLFLPERETAYWQASAPWPVGNWQGPTAFKGRLDRLPLRILDELPAISRFISLQGGDLTGDLQGYHDEKAPWNLTGQLVFEDGKGQLEQNDQPFESLHAKLTFDANDLRFETLKTKFDQGSIELTGSIADWLSLERMALDLEFSTRGLSLPVPFETSAADGRLAGGLDDLRLTGRALVQSEEFGWMTPRPPQPEMPGLQIQFQDQPLLPVPVERYAFDLIMHEAEGGNAVLPAKDKMPDNYWHIEGQDDRFRLITQSQKLQMEKAPQTGQTASPKPSPTPIPMASPTPAPAKISNEPS